MGFLVKALVLALGHTVIVKAQDYAYGDNGYGVENYDNKPTQSVSLHQNACALTDCAKLPYLQQCTPDWFAALKACTEPPCNVHYARNPAIDCHGDVSTTSEGLVPTSTESIQAAYAITTDGSTYNDYGNYGDSDITITEDLTVTATATSAPTGFPEIPKCAEPCFNQTVSTDGCEYTDAACHCTKTAAFEESFGTCIVNVCSPSDQQRYVWVLTDQCNALGVAVTAAPPTVPSPTLVPRQERADSGYPDIPECSKGCFNQTVATDGCEFTDAACHCTKVEAFQANFACIAEACSPPCQLRYQQILIGQCEKLGVPVTAPPTVPPYSDRCPVTGYPAIPECAAACFNQTLATDGCCFTDGTCHCSKPEAFRESFNNCVVNDCPSQYDQNAYIKVLDQSCDELCVPVPSESRLTVAPLTTPAYYVKRHTAYDLSSYVTSISGAVASTVIGCLDGEASSCPILKSSISYATHTGTPSSPSHVYNVTTASVATTTKTATTSIETNSGPSNASESFVQSTSPLSSNSAGIGAYGSGGSLVASLAVMTVLGWLVFAV